MYMSWPAEVDVAINWLLKQMWLFPYPYGFCNPVRIHGMKINDKIWYDMNVEVLNKKDTVHTECPLTSEFTELIQQIMSTSISSYTIHVKLKSWSMCFTLMCSEVHVHFLALIMQAIYQRHHLYLIPGSRIFCHYHDITSCIWKLSVFKSEKCTLIKSGNENWKCAFFMHTEGKQTHAESMYRISGYSRNFRNNGWKWWLTKLFVQDVHLLSK